MGYSELEAKIRADHQKEMDSIVSVSALDAYRVAEEIRGEANAAADRLVAQGRKKADVAYMRIVGKANLEEKRVVASEKSRLMDDVFEDAKAAVLALPDDRKGRLLNKLALDADLIAGGKLIRVDEKYRKLLRLKEGVRVVGEGVGDFGLIVEADDGSVRVDMRLGTLIEQAKSRLAPQVNVILFG